MVCSKCEKKQKNLSSGIITPDTWKEGSSQQKRVNENKLLSQKAKSKFEPYSAQCKICKSRLHQKGHHYCQKCSYSKGICSMCGIKVIDTSKYNQRTV
jgi:hypothetical protein